jgi:hypothetical protein
MLNLRLVCLLVLVIPGTAAHPQAVQPPVPPPTAEAQKLLDAGRLEESLKLLDT